MCIRDSHTFDSIGFLERVQPRLLSLKKDISVAVMGCSVNGPGEAHSATYAVTGNGRKVFIYKNGKLYKTVDNIDEADSALFEAIEND